MARDITFPQNGKNLRRPDLMINPLSEIVIKAENLGKMYTIGHQGESGHYLTLRDVLMKNARNFWSRTKDLVNGRPIIQGDIIEEVWALKDVNFEIRRGEIIGIVGSNGAGKSTLLKILSRITEPSTGRVIIKGRVANLLEIGTGFHPELTGRENIYLNGTILGMNRTEIKRKFDEIVTFAETEKYLDTPVKRYSTGMYVRLAFAVAAHLEPEILIVDEVLSVGDMQFQEKCLGKMESFGKDSRTVLFVSHNLTAISKLCTRGLVLDKGEIVFDGEVTRAIHYYMDTVINNSPKQNTEASRGNNDSVKFLSARIVDTNGAAVISVDISNPFAIEMKFRVSDHTNGILVPNCHFKTGDGLYAFIVNAPDMRPFEPGVYTASCKVPGNFFNEGIYKIGVAVTEYRKTSLKVHFFAEDYLTLSISESVFDNPLRYGYSGPIPGVLRPSLEWTVDKEDKA